MPDTEHRRPASTNPLTQVLGPFTRTGGFYARSWGAHLDRQPGELPVARPTIALAAQAFRDEIVLAGFRLLRSAPDATTRTDRSRGDRRTAVLWPAGLARKAPGVLRGTPPRCTCRPSRSSKTGSGRTSPTGGPS